MLVEFAGMYRTALTAKNYLAQNADSAEVENEFGAGVLNLCGILESFWGDLCPNCTQTD